MMSQQQKLTYLPLFGTIFLCLFVGVYLAAWKRFSKPGRSSTIIKHTPNTSSNDTLKYWTTDSMRNAKASDLPETRDLERAKQHPTPPPNNAG